MLLAIDIGNTNITCGVFRGATLVRNWRLTTNVDRTAHAYERDMRRKLGRKHPIDAVVCGSVVPRLKSVFVEVARSLSGRAPAAVTPRSALGIKLRVDRPSEVGADRLINALAACRKYGGPAIVLDFGTATTFDCISRRAEYLGGAILPGPDLSSRALSLHTAQLPRVKMRRTRRVIGKNTIECIQAGLYHGYAGMITHVLDRSIAEMRPGKDRVRVIATGGLARMFVREVPRIDVVEPDLTLHGLRLAYELIC